MLPKRRVFPKVCVGDVQGSGSRIEHSSWATKPKLMILNRDRVSSVHVLTCRSFKLFLHARDTFSQ